MTRKAINLFILNNLPMKEDRWGLTKKTEACEFCMRAHSPTEDCSLENLEPDARMGQVLAEIKYPRMFILKAKYASTFTAEISKFRFSAHAN